jgi:hypothetical protein
VCKYQFIDGSVCEKQKIEDSKYCILHTDLSEDKTSEEWKTLSLLKQERFNEKVDIEDYDFEGARFGDLEFHGEFKQEAFFEKATFSGNIDFEGVKFLGEAWFQRATFSGYSRFDNTTFLRYVNFTNSSLSGNVKFDNTIFSRNVNFTDCTISGIARFDNTKFLGETFFHITSIQKSLIFIQSEFKKSLIFIFDNCGINIDIRINHTIIKGDLEINSPEFGQNSLLELIGAKIEGNLSLTDTIILGRTNFNNLEVSGKIKVNPNNIRNAYAQENIFRKVKTHATELGDKKTSDEFFFLEKVAGKEILKNEIINSVQKIKQFSSFQDYRRNLKQLFKQLFKYIIEIPMQYYFCYGINPLRTFGFWIVIILIFSLFFWQFSWIEYNVPTTSANITLFGFDLTDYPRVFFFSVTNAMTPGYGLMHPKDGWPQLWAGIEAIFGAFTWGCFLTIFARKYMDK